MVEESSSAKIGKKLFFLIKKNQKSVSVLFAFFDEIKRKGIKVGLLSNFERCAKESLSKCIGSFNLAPESQTRKQEANV